MTLLRSPVLNTARGISLGDFGQLLLVTFLWALCFPLIASGLAKAPPLYFGALRSLVAGVSLLVPAFALQRTVPKGRRVWLILLGVGVSTTSMGFSGMFLAGRLISPGLATVLANIQPLIAAVLAYFLLSERLGPRRRMGLLLGFAGILLVAFPSLSVDGANSSLSGLGYILLGAVGVAVGNVLLKQLTGQVDLLMATGWQFILGGFMLFLISQRVEAPVQIVWDPSFIAILLVLGILGTAVAFALWFSLLHRSELNRLNTFTFLTPAFGLMIGTFFFGERLNSLEIVGVTLILGAVVWISRGSVTTNEIK